LSEFVEDLSRRLATWAEGLHGEGVAVALLSTHEVWLCHEGFVAECVFLIDPDGAAVDWLLVLDFLARTPCPDLDADILRMAYELARQRLGLHVAYPETRRQAHIIDVRDER
jgi:hypothetical protein